MGNDFVDGVPVLMIPQGDVIAPVSKEEDDTLTFDDHMATLDAMIGLTEIKQKVKEHALYLKFFKNETKHGLSGRRTCQLVFGFLRAIPVQAKQR